MERNVYTAAVAGSVIDLANDWMHQRTPVGNNVLHVHVGKTLGGQVGEKVRLEFIKLVLDSTAGQNNNNHSLLLKTTNNNEETPLHLAARFGHAGAVQEFLERLRQMNEATRLLPNKAKDTALHEAARAGHASVVKLLVGPDYDSPDQHKANNAGETPLYIAADKGCVESFGYILEACGQPGLHHKGPSGLTVLHIAVLYRNQGVVTKILQKDKSLIRVKKEEGQTPLHCSAAVHVRNLSILQLLLNIDDQQDNAAAYIQDNKGRTALHLATLNWNFEGIKMIIDSYPACVEIVDDSGQNVVHYAASLGCLFRFRRFLEHVPSCDRLLNDKDMNGDTPLHLLAATTPSLPSHDCFVHLPEFIKQYNYILDVKAYNCQNLTAGDIIASNSSLHHLAAAPPKTMSKILPRSRRRSNNGFDSGEVVDENDENIRIEEKNLNLKKVEEKITNLKKANETRLVVAALIATVSFTAGFTVPGGFYQNPGVRDTGLALLAKNAAFKAFLVSDTIAFTLSSLAIICYFVVARHEALVSVDNVSISADLLNSISLGALMIAFVTGVCAVVSHSPGLVATIVVISLFYFFFYLNLLLGTFGTLLAFMTRNNSKKARE